MSTIVTRSGKGSPLTHNEVDANFTNLNTDKVEKTSAAITGGAIDNTIIGGITPAAGTFTTLGVTTSINASSGSANADLNVNSKGTGSVIFNTTGGVQFKVFDTFGGGSSTANFVVYGRNSGSPIFGVQGSDTNINPLFSSKGASSYLRFATGADASSGNASEQVRISHTASAVNYVQVTGAATGGQPTISAQGSDTNVGIIVQSKGNAQAVLQSSSGNALLATDGGLTSIRALPRATGGDTWLDVQRNASLIEVRANNGFTNGAMLLASKGTGAIDLAAGSSGVNISNGGTVTALTRTAIGSGYTSVPSVAITAPTTAGGVQATASTTVQYSNATIAAGGTGYAVNDILTLVGGSGTTTVKVTTVSAGAVTAVTYNSGGGGYTSVPTNPTSTTGGTGSGCTLNVTWAIDTISIGTAGSGYVEQPTVSFSGGGGSGAAAYASVGATPYLKGIAGNLELQTAAGTGLRVQNSGTSNVNFAAIQGNSTGANVLYSAAGSDANIGVTISSFGTSSITLRTNNSAQEQIRVAHTASAVNYVQVTGAATGGATTISTQGSDSSITSNYSSKGPFSQHIFLINGYTAFQVAASNGVVANRLNAQASLTGFGPVLSATGSDTDIPLVLSPKGTGALQAQQTDSTATGGNARGANAVDWQTIRGSAGNVASAPYSLISGGTNNTSGATGGSLVGGGYNTNNGNWSFIGGGNSNTISSSAGGNTYGVLVGGFSNTAGGAYNFIGGGFTNSGTATAAVTTQSATMNGTTAVTLSGSNASIKVGQYITGTSIAADTYVAAVSGTSLTLSKNASGSSTSTLSFYTPHGVVVGGGNNQATGSYSFIGGGGDAGTAANRNVASGDWSFVGGGSKNIASGKNSVVVGGGDGTATYSNQATGSQSFVGGGLQNTAIAPSSSVVGGALNAATSQYGIVGGGYSNGANGQFSTVSGGSFGNARGITGGVAFPACFIPIASVSGTSQAGLLIIAKQTTDATATVLTSDGSAGGTTNQVILPNNSAYTFRGEIVSGVTGGGNSKSWIIEGLIKRGANAASTTLVGSTVTSMYADAGAVTWTIALSADTTNGGLAVTFTGQASTTIRTVCSIRTTEMTF